MKYSSRRFILACWAMGTGTFGVIMDRDLTSYGLLVGAVLAGYGFTRSKVINND